MFVDLTSFDFALTRALHIYYGVVARDGLIERPHFVRKAIAMRLKAGIAALEAFLRRVLILLALEIELKLVAQEKPENLARAKARMPHVRKPSLRIYPADCPMPDLHFGDRYLPVQRVAADVSDVFENVPVLVPIGHLLARLDYLHAIAKNPIIKARRLAFSLARSRHGLLMAPAKHPRLVRRWGTETSAIYDAMAFQIIHNSRSRPPPLPPPRRGPKPMITLLP